MFLDSESNYNGDITRIKNFFTMTEVIDHITQSVNNYYQLFDSEKQN